ncbi:MAG TPA: DUF58 domain-containing protein [Elusimicrobia bacterium]|nr:DUF58 domain-containing protein [Elusimicrobiota bacterium]
MNTAEILKKVRQIEIKTGRLVSETFAGEYQSVFKGRGMEFAEVREYVPGDDIRSIDWNVTARSSKPFVKRYIEERELTLLIICDISASQTFGSSDRAKNEAAAELAAMFAFSAMKNNDKTGLLLFTDRAELYIPPRKGKNHILRIIRELVAYAPANKGTDIAKALSMVNKIMKRKGIVFLLSDFHAPDFSRELRLTAQRHDLIPVVLSDPIERSLPCCNTLLASNWLEGGPGTQVGVADLSSHAFLSAYRKHAEMERKGLERTMLSAGVQWIDVNVESDIYTPVVKFFRQRQKRIRM